MILPGRPPHTAQNVMWHSWWFKDNIVVLCSFADLSTTLSITHFPWEDMNNEAVHVMLDKCWARVQHLQCYKVKLFHVLYRPEYFVAVRGTRLVRPLLCRCDPRALGKLSLCDKASDFSSPPWPGQTAALSGALHVGMRLLHCGLWWMMQIRRAVVTGPTKGQAGWWRDSFLLSLSGDRGVCVSVRLHVCACAGMISDGKVPTQQSKNNHLQENGLRLKSHWWRSTE